MTSHFDLREFACPCCGGNDIKPELIERLQKARTIAGVPFEITSGWRCKAHNREIKGGAQSSHMAGWAADIACKTSGVYFSVLKSLIQAGFNRIGRGRDYIHVDCDPGKPANVSWPYPAHPVNPV